MATDQKVGGSSPSAPLTRGTDLYTGGEPDEDSAFARIHFSDCDNIPFGWQIQKDSYCLCTRRAGHK